MDRAATPSPDTSTISFDDVVVHVDSYQLERGGETIPVEPQVFDVLCYLIEHRDRVVGKVELLDNIWGDQFVSESALTSRIKSARRAVGDDGRRQEVIRTTHGRGYRFVAEIITADSTPATSEADEQQSSPEPETETARQQRNVPAPARPLIARDGELEAVVALLTANRLVTVVGPGGVGKTRLATAVAGRWDHDFEDQVTFVTLATIANADEVTGAICEALGTSADDSLDPYGPAREALSGKSALLVLDNFEHVVEAATTLADLVESVPGIRILVTSRERLGLAGEQVLELDPLALTTADTNDPTASPAVLFFEHAIRGVGSDIALDSAAIDDVVAICETLDGLPLAIELAAAQTRYFPLPYLRTHLESQAIMVADNARDRPERHHTMSATIEWSFGLLTPSQQTLLTLLSVYRSGWPLEAASVMVDPSESSTGIHDLMALVDKSLVRRNSGALGEPRFSMLHLLREFAGAQLGASGRRTDALNRHAQFMATTIQSLESRRWSDPGDAWIDAIQSEYADAVAALTWCFGEGDAETGCQLVAALGFWWYRSGRLGEGRVWTEHALAHASATNDATMAWIHAAAGKFAAFQLRPEESREHTNTALTLARQIGDHRLEALSLCDVGEAAIGDPEQYKPGLAATQQGLDQARRLDTPQIIAHGLTVKGELTRANGEPDLAEAAYREALEFNVQIGNRYYEAINVLNMGHALMAQGRFPEALTYYRRGIELSTRIGSRIMMAWNLSELAAPQHLAGQPELSARLIGASQAALELIGSTYGPADQPIHDKRQQTLRDELGHDEYNRLNREGRQMTLEEGTELALSALGDPEHA